MCFRGDIPVHVVSLFCMWVLCFCEQKLVGKIERNLFRIIKQCILLIKQCIKSNSVHFQSYQWIISQDMGYYRTYVTEILCIILHRIMIVKIHLLCMYNHRYKFSYGCPCWNNDRSFNTFCSQIAHFQITYKFNLNVKYR